jgi:hypothetical protein
MIPMLLLSTLAWAAPEARVYGDCPGPITIEVEGATPGGSVVVITAAAPGTAVLPAGACIGTPSGLSSTGLAVRAVGRADAVGNVRLVASAPANACQLSLQVLDRESCTMSAVDELNIPLEAATAIGEVTETSTWLLRVGTRALCNASSLGLSPSEFNVQPLFRVQNSGVTSGGLHRYCRVDGLVPNALPASLQGVAERELSILTPMAAPPPGMFDLFTAQFDQYAGTPASVPPSGSPVTVSVIDASPTLETNLGAITTRGALGHGQVVASIVHRLTCPGVPATAADLVCPVNLRTQLALPLLLSETLPGTIVGSTSLGGHTGTLSQLAQAIVNAVDAVPSDRHVINLSLAWHPVHGGAIPGDPASGSRNAFLESGAAPYVPGRDPNWPVGVAAVFDALHYARCQGALVLAAAGNASAGPRGEEGMLLPAAWSALDPAGLDACSSLESGLGSSGGTPRAIVHAVGIAHDPGVFATPESPTGRPGGTPAVVAHGLRSLDPDALFNLSGNLVAVANHQEEAVVAGVWPSSGTSFSTPVVAAAAALAWTSNAALTPEDLMGLIYEKAAPTGLPTPTWVVDGWFPPLFDDHARFVRVCDVVQDVSGAPLACLNPTLPTLAAVATTTTPVYDTPITLSECEGSSSSVFARQLIGLTWVSTDRPCPSRQFYDALVRGGVHPQGPKDPCPVCSVRPSSNQLYVDVSNFADMTNLTVVAVTGGVTSYHPISDQPTAAGRVLEIPGLDLDLLDKMPQLSGLHAPSATAWLDEFVSVE